MINTILDKIGSVVEKDFLFSSFLPALLFHAAIGVSVAASIGIESTLAVVENFTPARLTWVSAVATLALIVFAYVLSGLRGPLIKIWSGDSALVRLPLWGFVALGEVSQRARFRRLKQRSLAQPDWQEILKTNFSDKVNARWGTATAIPGWRDRLRMKIEIDLLRLRRSDASVKRKLAHISNHYARFDSQSLTGEYEAVKRSLLDWDEEDSFATQAHSAALDREFGSLATIKATRLGNVIDSYNYYAYTRFNIEAELAWPRLQHVIPESYAAGVRDAKVILDFAITMATMAMSFAAFALLAGPWLVPHLAPWIIVAIVSVLIGFFFYQMGVGAAIQYGDLIRSSFDLFRLALLEQLGFERPANMEEERQLWLKYSQLIVYAVKPNVPIAAKGGP